jgi:hypothetical protein
MRSQEGKEKACPFGTDIFLAPRYSLLVSLPPLAPRAEPRPALTHDEAAEDTGAARPARFALATVHLQRTFQLR